MAIRYPLTIYYDSACPICASEMATLLRFDLHGRLALVDCAGGALDDACRAARITSTDLLARIHARDANGRWLIGVDGFVAAYNAAGLALLARFFGIRWLRATMDRSYRWIASHRYGLSRFGFHHLFRLVPHRAIRAVAARSVRDRDPCARGACRLPG